MATLDELATPCLVLDLQRLETNLGHMARHADALGVSLRPHIKTHKCVEIASRQIERGANGITVSTLYEARVFADHGFDDITWAFPLQPRRMAQVEELAARVRLGVVVDSPEAVGALEASSAKVDVWLKVDCGYGRAGVDPTGELAVLLAQRLVGLKRARFAGLLSHSGNAYQTRSNTEVRAIAEQERSGMVLLEQRLSPHGIAVPAISVGSTPTMTRVKRLPGVAEVRPGNYAVFDHTQTVLGSCPPNRCAATVLATVVSAQPERDHCVVDAGALALSKEPSHPLSASPTMGEIYTSYTDGVLSDHLRVTSLSQEHGLLSERLAVGERVRILPNHACLAIACFDEMVVVEGEEVVDRWKVWRGRDGAL